MDEVASRQLRKVKMNKKIQILAMAALVAFTTAAMPTEAERLEGARAKNVSASSALVAAKLDKIVLPSVSFKPPATLADAVKFLNEASVQYDSGPDKKGVKFVLSIGDDTPPAIPRIYAKNMRLRDLLQLIVKIAKCDYSVEGDVVRIYKK